MIRLSMLALSLAATSLPTLAQAQSKLPDFPDPAKETPVCATQGGITEGPFKPTVASLRQHNAAPEWFRDAKLGIYAHWGIYSVPAFGDEWYPSWMWMKDWPAYPKAAKYYEYHMKHYGGPKKFPYHKFADLFTAEKFDAEEWAELYQKAGARFAGPVAEHSDGYAMWDSDVTPWNVMDTGPKRDITGELAVALRKRGLKFMGSFHHDRHVQRYAGTLDITQRNEDKAGNHGWDSHYPWVKGLATSSTDEKLKHLYGNMPEEEWLREHWLGTVKEFSEKYDPDLIWFDAWLDRIPASYRLCMSADFLNNAVANGNADQVMFVHKQQDLPTLWSVEDFEKGRLDRMSELPWLTDDTISYGSWSYTQDLKIKSTRQVLHEFIDIVSKNGQLLLNISPKADGSIPQDQKDVLLGMGAWLERNGEAIYETRPWKVYGEGPTKMYNSGRFTKEVPYTPEDVRFTTNGPDTLYVIALGQPKGELKVQSLGQNVTLYVDDIATIEQLGVGMVEGWRRDADALVIPVSETSETLANVWKITRVIDARNNLSHRDFTNESAIIGHEDKDGGDVGEVIK